MSLRSGLILRLFLITVLVTVGSLFWVLNDTYATARQEVHSTMMRASAMVERSYRLGHGYPVNHNASRTSLDILSVMAPGTCIEFEGAEISRRMVCTGWQVFGEIPPPAFRAMLDLVFAPLEPLEQQDTQYGRENFYVKCTFDPLAAATRAWQQVKLALAQALLMGLGILLLGAGSILYSLRPVRAILSRIDQLAAGDLGGRVRPEGATEFRRIGGALDVLAQHLHESAVKRQALTRKLLEVEDVERRQLARDLHDEFGQILTATNALAASIEVAAAERDDITDDARAIGRNIRAMMDTLRGAFARLRPPDLQEIGLAASIRAMLTGWASASGVTKLSLECDREPKNLPESVALDLYRIVQECVTNAMRHGRPTRVRVTLSGTGEGAAVVIEDDGGGSIHPETDGHGLIGIRERIAAIGGVLTVASTDMGVRVAATLPAMKPEAAA